MNKIYEIEGALVFGILLMYAWTGNGFLFISGPIIMLLVWVWWWRQMNAAVLPFVAQIPERAETYQVDTDEHIDDAPIYDDVVFAQQKYLDDVGGPDRICNYCFYPRSSKECDHPYRERFYTGVKDLDNP